MTTWEWQRDGTILQIYPIHPEKGLKSVTFDNNAELSFSSEDGPTGRERIHKKNRISKSFIVFGKIIFLLFSKNYIDHLYVGHRFFVNDFPLLALVFSLFPSNPLIICTTLTPQ